MTTQLQRLLENPIRHFPGKSAIQSGGQRVTFAELDDRVRRMASGLLAMGIEPGERVAWMLPNCLEAVITTLACYQIGAVAVPLNYRYVAREARDVIARVAAGIIVFHTDKTRIVESLLGAHGGMRAVMVGPPGSDSQRHVRPFSSLLNADPIRFAVRVESNAPALILFTSGSTGHPKGVVHSHAGLVAGIEVSREIFDFTDRDVVLVGKPISHAGGLQTQLMPALRAGARVILAMKPAPAAAVAAIRTESVTEYGLLASDLLDFIEYLEENPSPLPTLNNCIGSGDAVPEDLHHRFRDLLGWEVMEGAGMTEVGGYFAANPRYGKRKWGSLGLPTPRTELRVVADDGIDCGIGETGEIVVRAPSATIGYWHDDQASADLLREGWLHTGDLGHLDEDGYLWFVGRKKLMIIRRGSNIAPAEVENVLDEHPSVHASVVVGVPDAGDGQLPVACVALHDERDDSSEDTLRTYVAHRLAGYKNPVHYLFFDELPRTSTGKFDRHRLQEIAADNFGS